ncbi:MAG: hypothetical protein JXB62_06910 [Pirellulales bacterium]|nr:hypothetical protein [Pirellulales bacterium]
MYSSVEIVYVVLGQNFGPATVCPDPDIQLWFLTQGRSVAKHRKANSATNNSSTMSVAV